MAAQFKRWVWTRYFLFSTRLNSLSDLIFYVIIFRFYKEHIEYVFIEFENNYVNLVFVCEFKYRIAKHRIRWLVLYVFYFSPYYYTWAKKCGACWKQLYFLSSQDNIHLRMKRHELEQYFEANSFEEGNLTVICAVQCAVQCSVKYYAVLCTAVYRSTAQLSVRQFYLYA